MKRLLHTPLFLLLWRIVLLYVVLMLCRMVFYLYNYELLGALSWHEAGQLLQGALKFDTASIVYAEGLFILLSLLPLPRRLRERGWWRNLRYGYYVAVGALLVVAVNMADCVYFRYTQKRFTAEELFFADNDNSAQLVVKFLGENWYLALVAAGLIALLAWGYRRKAREESLLRDGWSYYAGGTLLLALGAALSIAGMRGGMTRMTRPITLSNATLYTPDSGKANLILSNPFCILRTVGSSAKVSYRKYYAAEELDSLFTPLHMPADSAAVDLSGRNVVLFVMESMSAEHSAHLMPELYAGRAEQGFTPFLDSLMREGLCFERFYANGTRSIQALPSVLGSIPSFKTPFVLMPQALGRSRQLPAMLSDRGYETLFFCGSEHGSMGFGAYARSAGVERLVSREDYEAAHGKGDFDGYWGIWDEPSCASRARSWAARASPSSPRSSPSRRTTPSSCPKSTPTRFPRATPASTRGLPTTTWPSAASSNATRTRSGSAARFSSSRPTTSPPRSSQRRASPSPATCASWASSTRPTARCAAPSARLRSSSTSCRHCSGCWATASPTSPSAATCSTSRSVPAGRSPTVEATSVQ